LHLFREDESTKAYRKTAEIVGERVVTEALEE
jgi:hypothetical protein